MSTSSNPLTGLSAAQEAQNQYNALVAALAPSNKVALAAAVAGGTGTIWLPSLPALQMLFALGAAGLQPTTAQVAAVLTAVTVPVTPAQPVAAPEYVLGPQLGPFTWALDSLGAFPNIGTQITIGGQQYVVGALGEAGLRYTATLVTS
jgi:hypothetical protein